MRVSCGTSGYNYAPWRGPFYPEDLPKTKRDKEIVESILVKVRKEAPKKVTEKWGMLGLIGQIG